VESQNNWRTFSRLKKQPKTAEVRFIRVPGTGLRGKFGGRAVTGYYLPDCLDQKQRQTKLMGERPVIAGTTGARA